MTTNAYKQLPPDFRTVVLTADGKSADGKCFDVPYYKHVSSLHPPENVDCSRRAMCCRMSAEMGCQIVRCVGTLGVSALLHQQHAVQVTSCIRCTHPISRSSIELCACSLKLVSRSGAAVQPGAEDAGRPHRAAALCRQGPVRGPSLPVQALLTGCSTVGAPAAAGAAGRGRRNRPQPAALCAARFMSPPLPRRQPASPAALWRHSRVAVAADWR